MTKQATRPDIELIKTRYQYFSDGYSRNTCLLCDYALELEAANADLRRRLKEAEEKITAKVVCLCGSTRFTDVMLIRQWELTKQGHVVLSWCALPESYFNGPHVGDAEGVKEIVDDVHKRKIDLCDEIEVINVDGYIGDSTSSEIRYAVEHGKPVKWLYPEHAETNLHKAMSTPSDKEAKDE